MTIKEMSDFVNNSGMPSDTPVLLHRYDSTANQKCTLEPLEFAGNVDCQEKLGFPRGHAFILYYE